MAKPKSKKIPKRLAGVKLPKPLRRGLRDLARSQTGKTVLAEALAAAGAALVATQAAPGSRTRAFVADQGPKVKRAGGRARDDIAEARTAAVTALQEAARSFTDSLRGGGQAGAPPNQPSASTH
jgi:hypothetical protein